MSDETEWKQLGGDEIVRQDDEIKIDDKWQPVSASVGLQVCRCIGPVRRKVKSVPEAVPAPEAPKPAGQWRILGSDEIVKPTDEQCFDTGPWAGQWTRVNYDLVGLPRRFATIRRWETDAAALKPKTWQPMPPTPPTPPTPIDRGEKYRRTITQTLPGNNGEIVTVELTVDVYDILAVFEVKCPSRQHAIEKLLLAGKRGAKDEMKDLQEAGRSVERAIQLAQVY